MALTLVSGHGAFADERLIGHWAGTYECGAQGVAQLTLDVTGDAEDGVVGFAVGRTTGTYRVAIDAKPDGTIDFMPSGWIEKPNNVGAAARLIGRLGEDATTLVGKIPACRKGRFEMTRDGTTIEATKAPPLAQAPEAPAATVDTVTQQQSPSPAPDPRPGGQARETPSSVGESAKPAQADPLPPPEPRPVKTDLSGRWSGIWGCLGSAGFDRFPFSAILSEDLSGRIAGTVSYENGGKLYLDQASGIRLPGEALYTISPQEPVGVAWRMTVRRSASGYALTGELSPETCRAGRVRALRVTGEETAGEEEAIEGKLPPGPIELFIGRLGKAKTAEAQCAILEAWAARGVKATPGGETGARAVARQIVGAFADSELEPLIGLPSRELTTRDMRTLGAILSQTCGQKLRHRGPGQGLAAALERSEVQPALLAALRRASATGLLAELLDWQDKTDPRAWVAAADAMIESVRSGGQDDLVLTNEILGTLYRAPRNTPQEDQARLQKGMNEAIAHLKAKTTLSELEKALAEVSDGGIGTALRYAEYARRSNWPKSEVRSVVDAARAAARKALDPQLAAIADMTAKGVPQTLDGLLSLRDALRPVEIYGPSMDYTFDGLDPDHILQPTYAEIAMLERDPGVLAELETVLKAAAGGPGPIEAVEAAVGRLLPLDGTSPEQEVAAMIDKARKTAERNQVEVLDQSGSADGNEPTADDIADAVLANVRQANAIAQKWRETCPATGVTDDLVVFGTCGAGISWDYRLDRLVKLACTSESLEENSYRCQYVSTLSNLGNLDVFGPYRQSMEKALEVDNMLVRTAIFTRASNGGWQAQDAP
ncbi:hypothetical protein [Albidovulum sp.]|uniref:hypothetical protein n=1 Tax=Albidovulum sp. TaxID=1872424 RepID=UPI0039B91CFB